MKTKDYNLKRKDLKDKKRKGMKEGFDDVYSRKKFVDGVKTEFRALKRSEKQAIKQTIEEELKDWDVTLNDGLEDE